MNSALAFPHDFKTVGFVDVLRDVGEQFALLRAPSKKSVKRLSGNAESTLRGVAEIIHGILDQAVSSKSAAEFCELREDLFPKYARAMRIIADYAHFVVAEGIRTRLAAESFAALSNDFEVHGDAFGAKVKEQALFTIWTFKKLNTVIDEIVANANNLPLTEKERDNKLLAEFQSSVLWSRFHLDCLTHSISNKKPIYPEARDVICQGLRAAVNAYAYAKQAALIRAQATRSQIGESSQLDAEDRQLIAESMRDLDAEILT